MQTQPYKRSSLVITARSVAMAATLALTACVAPGGSVRDAEQSFSIAAVRYIEPGEVRQLQLKGGVALIHVGNDLEYDQRHIGGAAPRALGDLESMIGTLSAPGQVVLYSAGFGDLYSDRAQPVLRKFGERVVVMKGGLAAWERDGFPVEGRKDKHIKPSCQPVTANELRRALANLEDVVLIDLRQKQDYEAAHIPGAVSVMPHELDKQFKSLHKGRWVVLYHQAGNADMAGEQFIRQGFRYCGYLAGGYQAWLTPKEAARKP